MQRPSTLRLYDRSRVNKIRENVGLIKGSLSKIPDELLILAFTPPGKEETLGSWESIVIEKYNFKNSDYFEWLGDAVLELIVTDMIFEVRRTTRMAVGLRTAHEVRQQIVSNESIICMMRQKELFSFIPGWQDNTKRIADAFEALLGAVYFYFTRIEPFNFIIREMIDWLMEFWQFRDIIFGVVKRQGTPCSLISPDEKSGIEQIPEPASTELIRFPANRYDPPLIIDCTRVGKIKNGILVPIRLSDKSRKWLKEHKYNLTLVRNPELIRDKYVAYLYLYPYGTPEDKIRATTCISASSLDVLAELMESRAEKVVSNM